MQHLLSVDDMKENYIFDLWSKAIDQKNNHSNALKNKVLTNLFYEPSTRTSSSFYSAMVRQGGSVIPINNVKFSSAIKGESLEDTYNRVIPYFENEIMPALQKNKNVIISAHGNSLRALVKFIEEISKEEIVKLEIATGEPIFYEFNEKKLQRKLNW